MTSPREPIVTPVAVKELRPMQMTVGMREVELKRQMIRAQSEKETGTFLGRHMVPVVLGPKKRNYVVDHHHMARALLEEGVKVTSDLSKLDKDAFLTVLDNRGRMHQRQAARLRRAAQEHGRPRRRPLPQRCWRIAQARRLRQGHDAFQRIPVGGFPAPAHRPGCVAKSFDKAIKRALALAKSEDADYLPGWCGPTSD